MGFTVTFSYILCFFGSVTGAFFLFCFFFPPLWWYQDSLILCDLVFVSVHLKKLSPFPFFTEWQVKPFTNILAKRFWVVW